MTITTTDITQTGTLILGSSKLEAVGSNLVYNDEYLTNLVTKPIIEHLNTYFNVDKDVYHVSILLKSGSVKLAWFINGVQYPQNNNNFTCVYEFDLPSDTQTANIYCVSSNDHDSVKSNCINLVMNKESRLVLSYKSAQLKSKTLNDTYTLGVEINKAYRNQSYQLLPGKIDIGYYPLVEDTISTWLSTSANFGTYNINSIPDNDNESMEFETYFRSYVRSIRDTNYHNNLVYKYVPINDIGGTLGFPLLGSDFINEEQLQTLVGNPGVVSGDVTTFNKGIICKKNSASGTGAFIFGVKGTKKNCIVSNLQLIFSKDISSGAFKITKKTSGNVVEFTNNAEELSKTFTGPTIKHIIIQSLYKQDDISNPQDPTNVAVVSFRNLNSSNIVCNIDFQPVVLDQDTTLMFNIDLAYNDATTYLSCIRLNHQIGGYIKLSELGNAQLVEAMKSPTITNQTNVPILFSRSTTEGTMQYFSAGSVYRTSLLKKIIPDSVVFKELRDNKYFYTYRAPGVVDSQGQAVAISVIGVSGNDLVPIVVEQGSLSNKENTDIIISSVKKLNGVAICPDLQNETSAIQSTIPSYVNVVQCSGSVFAANSELYSVSTLDYEIPAQDHNQSLSIHGVDTTSSYKTHLVSSGDYFYITTCVSNHVLSAYGPDIELDKLYTFNEIKTQGDVTYSIMSKDTPFSESGEISQVYSLKTENNKKVFMKIER